MQVVLFGKKKKHVVVPDGFVLLDNHQEPEKYPAILEFRGRDGNTVYDADRCLSFLHGKFVEIDPDDFKDLDGNPIENMIENYAIICRDKRAFSKAPTLPDGVVIEFDPETDDEWRIKE